MGDVVWGLSVNSFSKVFKNEDNTFSVVFLKEKHGGGYVPLQKVYKQIESLLIKALQDKVKVEGVERLFEKYNVEINNTFFAI